MTAIVFLLPDGTSRAIQAEDGMSLMRAALNAGVRGVTAECGGFCQCATCHVYLNSPISDLLDPPSTDEHDMLEGVSAPRLAESRLSCQIVIKPELDGMVVEIPGRQ